MLFTPSPPIPPHPRPRMHRWEHKKGPAFLVVFPSHIFPWFHLRKRRRKNADRTKNVGYGLLDPLILPLYCSVAFDKFFFLRSHLLCSQPTALMLLFSPARSLPTSISSAYHLSNNSGIFVQSLLICSTNSPYFSFISMSSFSFFSGGRGAGKGVQLVMSFLREQKIPSKRHYFSSHFFCAV